MSANHRQYWRCPLSDGDSPTVLVVNWRSYACKLVEMSIGGFGVITGKSVRVGETDRVRLKTRGLDYIVRVSYQKPCEEGVFLGLDKIEEILPDNTVPPAHASAKWLTTAAWVAALSTVAIAVYCMSGGLHELLPK